MKLRSHPRRPSPAMLVAVLALFVALASGAYAAGTINGNSIKNGTIKGSKLKKNTLTGKQINESALSPVPKATSADMATNAKHADLVGEAENAIQADTAANAMRLGGIVAANYVRGVHLVTARTTEASHTNKSVTAFCPGNEVALAGGGNNNANTGAVTFDRMQLEPHSFTVTEFEIVGGIPTGPWIAEAEVLCAVP